jgi:hypothetical protein
MVTLHPVSNHFCWGGGGGGVNPLVEVTVNSKEKNSQDFCPIYVQEFDFLKNNGTKNRCGLLGLDSWISVIMVTAVFQLLVVSTSVRLLGSKCLFAHFRENLKKLSGF